MKTVRTKFAAAFLLTAATSFAVILSTAANARAQRAAPQRDLSGTERDIRALESATEKKKDSKTTLAEVNEDFGRLRAINDEFKSANSSGAALDYKAISDASAEIRKRATRLKANLAGLPKPEKEEKRQKESVPADGAQMKSLLSSLNDLMTSFLTNPVFSDMGTLDNQLAAKARRDLESLIDLSDIVRKGAEKLGKQAGQ